MPPSAACSPAASLSSPSPPTLVLRPPCPTRPARPAPLGRPQLNALGAGLVRRYRERFPALLVPPYASGSHPNQGAAAEEALRDLALLHRAVAVVQEAPLGAPWSHLRAPAASMCDLVCYVAH